MDLYGHSFSENPTNIDIQRSRFDVGYIHKTTFNEGDLVPVGLWEVLPGDTFSMDTSFLCRMTTPVFPVMDNADLDIYYFFVPNRLVWKHWQEFCGENTTAPWSQEAVYTVPQLKFANTVVSPLTEDTCYNFPGSLANYLGAPCTISSASNVVTMSDLPNRAYRLIWNEFFRDENLQYPVPIYTDDNDRNFGSGNDGDYGLALLKANKHHDYFTSCLPGPQKGGSVLLPLGTQAPVVVGDVHSQLRFDSSSNTFMHFKATNSISSGVGNVMVAKNIGSSSSDDLVLTDSDILSDAGASNYMLPSNLVTDLRTATAATINQLRQAFQVQRLLERDSRSGSRYIEILKSHFGVVSPDARLQRPEYLGGFRTPINMDTILQTSSTDSTSPQANASGYSCTGKVDSTFTKSFVEHGMLFALATVRVKHTYSQGLERFLSRKRRFDFYYPSLANLGEMSVLKKEIYATGSSTDDSVFGYQEAWADYRFKPDRASGLFAPSYHGTTLANSDLSSWLYSDYYTSVPSLSSSWIAEDSSNVQNTLAVQDEPQFICDFSFRALATRPMPVYSVPGLIDHN